MLTRSAPTPAALSCALSSALALCAAGCGDEEAAGPQPVAVSFAGLVGGEPAACGQRYSNLGTTSTSYTLEDFRLYIHDLRMVDAEGNETEIMLDQDGQWQVDNVALLDFETAGSGCPSGTASTHTTVSGMVSGGPFTGIRFRVGVPFEKNHADAAAAKAPLNVTSMFWSWQGGYKFIRLDGKTTGLAGGHFLHLGSTGCDGSPVDGGTTRCDNENRMDVELSNFDPATQTIAVDAAEILAESDLNQNLNETAAGCMSNPLDTDCAPIFKRLGLPFPGMTPGAQRLFAVAP